MALSPIDLSTIAAGAGGFVINGQSAGDGFGDLIVGAIGADPAGGSAAGKSYTIFGRNFANIVTQPGASASETLTGGGGNDTLRVSDLCFIRADGNAGDTLNFGLELWTQGAAGGGYTPYTLGQATVQVVMLDKGMEPIAWIGHRHIDCRRHPKPASVWPVRIAAHAFGLSKPARDLFLSPDHAVYVGDVLIPVKYLINGATIGQIPVDEVTYYHIELPRHDLILAEGLPVESYLDTGDRSSFSNQPGAFTLLHPEFAAHRWEMEGCAPLIVHGPMLDAARAWLGSRISGARSAERDRPCRALGGDAEETERRAAA